MYIRNMIKKILLNTIIILIFLLVYLLFLLLMVGIVTSIPKPLMFFPINFIVLTMIFFAIVFPMEHALRYIGLFWLVNSSDYNFFKKVKFTNAFWLGTIDDPFLEEFYKELNK